MYELIEGWGQKAVNKEDARITRTRILKGWGEGEIEVDNKGASMTRTKIVKG